jgi:hypothetical protein
MHAAKNDPISTFITGIGLMCCQMKQKQNEERKIKNNKKIKEKIN